MGRKLQYGRFGLTENPVGLYVALPWKDSKGEPRTLLGEVIRTRYNETRGCILLYVRHFNGEDWPIEPVASAVEVIR